MNFIIYQSNQKAYPEVGQKLQFYV